MKTPDGWHSTQLHRVAEVRSGLSKSSNREGPTIRKPYLRVANVQDGFLDLSEIKEIDVPENQVSRFTLKPGDLLLIEGNGNPENLGRGCIWDGQIPDCVHQNHVFAVRTLPNAELMPEFLALQLQSDRGRKYLLTCAKGSTGLSTLNTAQLKAFPLVIPNVAEQRSITDAIACWDIAIEGTGRLIAAKNLRLNHLREHSLNKPKHFIRAKLHAVTHESTVRNGKRLGREAIMAVTKQNGMRPMREETIAAAIDRYKVVRPNAFAYNPMRLNIGSIAMSSFNDDVLVSPDYVVFECNEGKLLPGYLNHLRRTRLWVSHFEAAGSGGVRIRIYYDDLGAFSFWLPELDVQQRIVALLDACAAEVDTLERCRAALEEQKRGLMQKLLTGQWRVRTKEEEVPA